MRLRSSIVLLAPLCLTLACKANNEDTGASEPATTTTTTTTATPTTTPDPTSTGAPDPSTTSTTDPSTTTTGAPLTPCVDHPDKNTCEFATGCKWDSVFQFSHGANGCQADVIDFCTADTAGAPSTWYRGEDGDYQVVQFEYLPDDLPPEWKPCDCDGPLACFCAFDAPECPERTQEFCGATATPLACDNAVINGMFQCAWFVIQPEGPKDDTCTGQAFKPTCLAAGMAGSDNCTKLNLQPAYGDSCANQVSPVFWREVDGVIEVTSICGPIPPAPEWTPCSETDTPDQPDECKCACT